VLYRFLRIQHAVLIVNSTNIVRGCAKRRCCHTVIFLHANFPSLSTPTRQARKNNSEGKHMFKNNFDFTDLINRLTRNKELNKVADAQLNAYKTKVAYYSTAFF